MLDGYLPGFLPAIFVLIAFTPVSWSQTTGGPYIMVSPHNLTAIEGQRIQFSCGAEAYPNNITYYWFKSGIDVKKLSGYKVERIKISPDGNLLIKSVVKEDMAWYMCRPSNGIGEDEASAYLNVTYFPKVLPMPSQLTWAKGFREKIDCPVDANPVMTETIWTKDAKIIGSNSRMDILTNGSLVIRNVSLLDKGSYSCTPISLLGRGEASKHVQVIVRDPPYFTQRPLPLYQKNPGQRVVLPCSATGTPQPKLSWRKLQGILEISERVQITQGNLSFNRLVKEDHGTYECVATNNIATIISVTELRIMNTTPHAPYNITVVTGLFSAKVSWEPAYDGGSPQRYILWFREGDDDSNTWETITVPQGSTSFTLYALLPNTLYEFMVLSRNEYGEGMYSERARAKTLGFDMDLVTALPTNQYGSTYIPDIKESLGPAPSPPQNVTAELMDDGILVAWQHPKNTTVPIFSFSVHFRTDGQWTRYNGIIPLSEGLSILMKEMSPGTTYQIRVLSNGVLAKSEPSNIVTVTTKQDTLTMPHALLGGIIGGLLFLLVAILLAVIAVIHSRKKEQKAKNNSRFTDVNYSKPEDSDRWHETAPKWDRWQHSGGRDTLTTGDFNDGVFILPQTADLNTKRDMDKSILRDKRLYDRDHYDPSSGYRVAPSGDQSFRESLPIADVSLSRAPSRGSRSASSGRPREESDWSQRYPDDLYPSSVMPPSERSANYPDPRIPQLSSSFPDSYSRDHPRGASLSPVTRGYDGPFQSFEDDDDVFPIQHRSYVPSSITRPGFPRHSSMKPASQQQTYLTDPNPLFGTSDISSVFPSSFSDPSREQSSVRQPDHRHPDHRQPHHREPDNRPQHHGHLDPRYPDARQPDRLAPKYDPWNDRPSRPRQRQGVYNIPKETQDFSPNHDKQIAWVQPSKVHEENNSSAGSSAGRPVGYTRDQLQGAVDRVRHSVRPHSTEDLHDDNGFLDVSSQLSRPRSSSHHDPSTPRQPFYPSDIAPFKPPRDSRGSNNSSWRGPRDSSRSRDETVPDSMSHSSGIGSRNTSQSNGSYPNRLGKNSVSYSSLLTPQDQDLSQDSSPFLEGGSHRRDTSGDENYEFDSINALENEILDALRNYSQLSAAPETYNDLYPKPRRQSRYADSEQRFNRLREEFKKYREQQHIDQKGGNPGPLYPMDSEML